MAFYNKWRCPRCNYTTDPEVMDREARLYYSELKPGMKDLIKKLFNIASKNKIKKIDTSPVYNNSEKMIGLLNNNRFKEYIIDNKIHIFCGVA